VRVRRLKQNDFTTEGIETACKKELRELRRPHPLDEIIPELWVRGPERAFHRYRVMCGALEEVPMARRPLPPELRNIRGFKRARPRDGGGVREIPYEK
jgi:hypothetical protein